jgi:DNA-binding protein H-NS
MTTYSELKAQAAELLKQAERLRKEEIRGVVAEIKAKMAEYGITIDDLKTPFKGWH